MNNKNGLHPTRGRCSPTLLVHAGATSRTFRSRKSAQRMFLMQHLMARMAIALFAAKAA